MTTAVAPQAVMFFIVFIHGTAMLPAVRRAPGTNAKKVLELHARKHAQLEKLNS